MYGGMRRNGRVMDARKEKKLDKAWWEVKIKI